MSGSLIKEISRSKKAISCCFLILVLFSSCKTINQKILNEDMGKVKSIDVQGHRGCRGLLPENTIPAFMKAMELGVTTLESLRNMMSALSRMLSFLSS